MPTRIYDRSKIPKISEETRQKLRQCHLGAKAHNWKEGKLKYSTVHMWLRRTFGRASHCEICGKGVSRFEWANISGEYKRDISDWKQLCKKCHIKFDDTINRGWKTKKTQ